MADDFEPWTEERFRKGNRVTWTEKAIAYNIPTKSRRTLRGTVTGSNVGTNGKTWDVSVLWDGYRRPHQYAGSFIRKVSAKGG